MYWYGVKHKTQWNGKNENNEKVEKIALKKQKKSWINEPLQMTDRHSIYTIEYALKHKLIQIKWEAES